MPQHGRLHLQSRRVLIVPDAFWGGDSGAIAARDAATVWADLGFDIGVFAAPATASPGSYEQKVSFFERTRDTHRLYHQLFGRKAVAQFAAVLDEFRPSHAFFIGGAISKPAGFFRACALRGIRTIGFWWVQDFFCARGYACLSDGPCTLCLRGNYLHAFINRCGYGDKWLRQASGGSLARLALRRNLVRMEAAMGSTTSQLRMLERFGFPPRKLVLCPLFFDKSRVVSNTISRGDYYVCYGQARMEKGWHLLAGIIERSTAAKFVLPFATFEAAERALETFGLGGLVARGRIEIRTGISWATGVSELVAGARGVLIPSIWPTTTEFTLLESLGLGKPVVAFDVGVHAEFLRSRVSALLAPVGEIDEMASSLDELASDDKLYDTLSIGARVAFDYLTLRERYHAAFLETLEVAETHS